MSYNWNDALEGKYGEFEQECAEHCKSIADELQDYVDGKYWIDESENITEAVEGEDPPEGMEVATLYDYLRDNYGVWSLVDSYCEVTSVRVLVAFGGPNIYIDTHEGEVQLYWGATEACYPLSGEVIEKVDEWGEDWFETFVLPRRNGGRY